MNRNMALRWDVRSSACSAALKAYTTRRGLTLILERVYLWFCATLHVNLSVEALQISDVQILEYALLWHVTLHVQ